MDISVNNNYSVNNYTKINKCTSKTTERAESTQEYFQSICKKFPELKLNMTTARIGSATEPVINLSPKLVEKMSKDPKLAAKIENDLKYEGMAFQWYKAMCKANGYEVTFNCAMYTDNGDCYGVGALKTASSNNNALSEISDDKKQRTKKFMEKAERLKKLREKEIAAKQKYAQELETSMQNKYNNNQNLNINFIDMLG